LNKTLEEIGFIVHAEQRKAGKDRLDYSILYDALIKKIYRKQCPETRKL